MLNSEPLDNPSISVCIATCNGERYIGLQLQSILAQLSDLDEVVISDDSSTDGTLQIIESFGDKRIRVFAGQTFRSPVYNFEHALRNARGAIIVLSDQDDEWVPGRISIATEELKRFSLVVCDAEIINAEGEVVRPSLGEIYRSRPGLLLNLTKNRYTGCCMAFRREVLEAALPFPANLPWHDWWIGLVAESFFSTVFLEDKLIRYRRHSSNVSNTGGKSTFPWKARIAHRCIMALALARRAMKRHNQTKG